MPDLQRALKLFFEEWQRWLEQAQGYRFASLQPIHVGWKVADESALTQLVAELLPLAEQVHVGTVDNRKIALLALKQPVERVPILQIMQLRPGSADPLGLDHVAFYCKDLVGLQAALEGADYRWERQNNSGHAWISLWFGERQREVKFFDHTSLDVAARELQEASQKIIG